MEALPSHHDSSLQASGRDDIDLVDVARILWGRKWLIMCISLACAAIAAGYALLATQWYRSEALLAPADEKSLPSGSIGQLGALASIAGLSAGSSETSESIAVLRSRDFTQSFISDLDLTAVLLSGRLAIFRSSKALDIRDAVEYFDKNVRTVVEDKKSGFVTLAIEWKDPAIAAEWAGLLVERLNARMREQALVEAGRNVTYLQQEMASAGVVPLQQSVGRLLESELQKLMLARGNEEFAFKVIDQATPPKYRSRPQRRLIVSIALVLGGIVASFGVLANHFLRPVRRT